MAMESAFSAAGAGADDAVSSCHNCCLFFCSAVTTRLVSHFHSFLGGFNPSTLSLSHFASFLLRHMCVLACIFREKECYAIFMNAAAAADLIAVSRKII